MEQTQLSSITFVSSTEVCGTIPRLEGGQLRVEVKCDPAMTQVILWHEGAHVYLFHLGYPPCQFQGKSYLLPPVDFVAEYLATKLELERRYRTQPERERELRQRLDQSLLPLPIRGLQLAQPGVGRTAISAAICAAISQDWTNPLSKEIEKTMECTIDELKTIYKSAVAAFQQTPSIPFGSSRLTNDTVQTIKSILSTSFNEVYNGACTIQFIT
jgi:hypothetical protein